MTTGQEIGVSKSRLETMKVAVADFDRRIAQLKRASMKAAPRDKFKLESEAASLERQRSMAAELVAEAAEQLHARQTDHATFVVQTRRNLERISIECNNAAQRFDDAVRKAAGALEELEVMAEPLVLAGFLPSGLRTVSQRANVENSFRRAFGDRWGELAVREPSMVARVTLLLSNARQNAARSREAA